MLLMVSISLYIYSRCARRVLILMEKSIFMRHSFTQIVPCPPKRATRNIHFLNAHRMQDLLQAASLEEY